MEYALVEVMVIGFSVLLISFMKGAFGGGFAIIGIPFLSLVMDPISAGVLLAPLLVVMDLFALRYWKPDTCSKPDIKTLIPALLFGICLGYVAIKVLNPDVVAIVMAVIMFWFSGLWFFGKTRVSSNPYSALRASLAGCTSGITTMVAHSGGPPLAVYLLDRRLEKSVYVGTTSMFFTIGNLAKLFPWLLLGTTTALFWKTVLLYIPVVPVGIWLGWKFHQRLNKDQLYKACYGLLVIVAIKLLWDGLYGYVT